MSVEHPFQPGVEVAVLSGHNHQNFKLAKVARVYKTDKFVLEGDAQRWKARQSWRDDRRWYAEPTGRTWYPTLIFVERAFDHGGRIIVLNDETFQTEHATEAERLAKVRRANSALAKVREIHRGEWLNDWQLEALENFVRLYEGVKVETGS